MSTKKALMISGALAIFFLAAVLSLMMKNYDLRNRIKGIDNTNKEKLERHVEGEREKIKRDLDKKYYDDRKSFRTLYERVKFQKAQRRGPEKQIKN